MIVAILGAGSGGASAAVELSRNGHAVRLWNRSGHTLEPFIDAGGIRHEGVMGNGIARLELMSTDLGAVIDGADVLLICTPTLAHADLADRLADMAANTVPVVLNPGHTGGALAFRTVFEGRGVTAPPIAEFSTLTYVARKSSADTVATTGTAKRVWVAALPGDEDAVRVAQELYPAASQARDVLATGLCNVNMVLHPPGAVLGAAWVEATRGDFTFYVDGLSDGVSKVMQQLDVERLAVAAAYQLQLPDLFAEMQAIGTIEADADAKAGLAAAIRSGNANRQIMAPDSLRHRYYVEDFFFGLRPFLVLAGIADIEAGVARALMTLAEMLVDPTGTIEGRSAKSMGVADMSRDELLQLVRG